MANYLSSCVNQMNAVVNSMSSMSSILANSTADLGRQARVLAMKQQAILVSESDVNVAKLARNEARLADLRRLAATANRHLDVLATEKRTMEDERKKHAENVESAVGARLKSAEEDFRATMGKLAKKKAELSTLLGAIEVEVGVKEKKRDEMEVRIKESSALGPEEIALEEKRRLAKAAAARVAELNGQITSLSTSLDQRRSDIEALQSGKAKTGKGKGAAKREREEQESREEAEATSAVERLRKQIDLLKHELETRMPADPESLKAVMLADAQAELTALEERKTVVADTEIAEKRAKLQGSQSQLSVLVRNFAPNQRTGMVMARVLQIVLENEGACDRDALYRLYPIPEGGSGSTAAVDAAVSQLVEGGEGLGLLKENKAKKTLTIV